MVSLMRGSIVDGLDDNAFLQLKSGFSKNKSKPLIIAQVYELAPYTKRAKKVVNSKNVNLSSRFASGGTG